MAIQHHLSCGVDYVELTSSFCAFAELKFELKSKAGPTRGEFKVNPGRYHCVCALEIWIDILILD